MAVTGGRKDRGRQRSGESVPQAGAVRNGDKDDAAHTEDMNPPARVLTEAVEREDGEEENDAKQKRQLLPADSEQGSAKNHRDLFRGKMTFSSPFRERARNVPKRRRRTTSRQPSSSRI